MLIIYRRHKKACKHRDEGRDYRRCQCPIWVDGSLAGQEIRKTLGTRDWTEASRQVQEWEAAKEISEHDGPISLSAAWEGIIADLEARKLSDGTIRKYKLLRRQITGYAEEHGLTLLSQFNLDTTSRFRATWKEGTRTASKKLERLRAFFRFCFDRQWVESNPAAKIKMPKVSTCPTMPLTHEEWVRLLTACDNLRLSARTQQGKLIAHRLKTLILVMRYTGLRVSDSVGLTVDRIDGNKIFLYTAKTGVPVYTILPDSVVRALEETPRTSGTRFFWYGESRVQTAIGEWQERIKKVFDLAGIAKGLGHAVSHRLRDTFAVELLLAGVPLERVSILLGHQSIAITEKHYSPWTRSRQEQIEADLTAAWKMDPALTSTKGAQKVREKKVAVN